MTNTILRFILYPVLTKGPELICPDPQLHCTTILKPRPRIPVSSNFTFCLQLRQIRMSDNAVNGEKFYETITKQGIHNHILTGSILQVFCASTFIFGETCSFVRMLISME